MSWAGVQGSYATHIVMPSKQIMVLPKILEDNYKENVFNIAAAIPLQGLTAHYLATSSYEIKKGDIVLIHAGTVYLHLFFVYTA